MRQAYAAAGRWFGENPARAWAALFGLYLVGRIALGVGGQVFTSYDAFTYRERPGQPDPGLVSFVGHAPRPWGLPLFYAIFGSDVARAAGQWAIGTVAWALLAWEAGQQLVTRAGRYAITAGILLLALTQVVASWDMAILTESLSLSLGAAALGLLLHWLRTGRAAALAGMTAVAIWWTFLRPDIRVFTAVVIGCLVLVAARLLWRGRGAADGGRLRARERRGQRRTAVAALAAAAILGLSFVWYAAITPAMEQTATRYDKDEVRPPMKQDEHRLVYRLRVEVSTNPRLWAAFKTELGMPTCPELEAFTADRVNWRGQAWAYAYRRCPPLVEWVNARKNQYFWTGLAEADPVLFAQTFLAEISHMMGGEVYAKVPHVVPAFVEKMIYPSRRYGLPLALLGFGASLGAAWWSGAARRLLGGHARRRHDAEPPAPRSSAASVGHRRLVWFAVTIFGTALLSCVSTIMLVTGELQRFGVQEAVASRVAMVVLLGVALDAWLLRRGGATATARAAAEPGATERPGPDPAGGVNSTAAATPGRAQATA